MTERIVVELPLEVHVAARLAQAVAREWPDARLTFDGDPEHMVFTVSDGGDTP